MRDAVAADDNPRFRFHSHDAPMSAAHSPLDPPNGPPDYLADGRPGETDRTSDPACDDIVMLAATLCATPAAAIWLHGRGGWWSNTAWGDSYLHEAEALGAAALETPSQVLLRENIPRGLRFRTASVHAGQPDLRFYAGVPLAGAAGRALGVLCVMDARPRKLTAGQVNGLQALARQAQQLMALRSRVLEQEQRLSEGRASSMQMEQRRAELERRNLSLQRTAERDYLTGLLNRTALAQLRDNPRAMQKLETAPYTLALLDVDHFKQVNDRYGHLLGDRALRVVADAVTASVRSGDVAVRYGGEEFLIVLPNTGLTAAYEVAHRIRERVAASTLPFPLTVSAGIAAGDPLRDRPEQVFERADQALYQAKASGRNRVVADDTPQLGV